MVHLVMDIKAQHRDIAKQYRQEQLRQYNTEHKDGIKEQRKGYKTENKDDIKEQRKEY